MTEQLHAETQVSDLLLPGDIFLTTTPGGGRQTIVARLISALTREWQESSTRVTHAGLVASVGTFTSARGLEMTWPRLRMIHLAEVYSPEDMLVYRPRFLTWGQRLAMVRGMEARCGERYGLFKLLAYAADAVVNRWISRLRKTRTNVELFRRLDLTGGRVCSQVIAGLYQSHSGHMAALFGRRFHLSVTPDDIDDYCRRHPLEFRQIHPAARPVLESAAADKSGSAWNKKESFHV